MKEASKVDTSEIEVKPILLGRAIEIAAAAHKNQRDLGGDAYILHPLRVMMGMEKEEEMVVAVLHDVLEDTDIQMGQLANEGLGDNQQHALDCLTRRDGEEYDDFVDRCLANKIARKVKIKDIEDNMRIDRIINKANPKPRDMNRMKRYMAAWDKLTKGLAK